MRSSLNLILVFVSAAGVSQASVLVSQGMPTRQSTTHSTHTSEHAVDGCTDVQLTLGCCAHTGPSQPEAWWQVDLQNQFAINQVTIYYRDDSAIGGDQKSRFAGYQIFLSSSRDNWKTGYLCFKDTTSIRNSLSLTPTISCEGIATHLTIYVDRRSSSSPPSWYSPTAYLELCEVEVYGCPIEKFGNGNCDSTCDNSCLDKLCHPVSGQCNNCSTGYYGTTCESCPSGCSTNDCDTVSGKCTGCNSGFYGILCDAPCPINCKDSICEQNAGQCSECKPGFYGDFCIPTCPSSTCKDNICLQTTGSCTECKPGYHGRICDNECPSNCQNNTCAKEDGQCAGCNSGFYGILCDAPCPINCKDSICEQNAGQCSGCNPGFRDTHCHQTCPANCRDECKSGFYGDFCILTCTSSTCKDNICLQTTGSCTECKPGYHGRICDNECPSNCQNNTCAKEDGQCAECKPGYHGRICDIECPSNCQNNACVQEEGQCAECTNGWYGSNCSMNCSNECKNTICIQSTGDCKECIKGKYGTKCSLPCNETCSSCRKEDGSCTECVPKYHGTGCTHECGHCSTGTCDMDSGSCPCETGWEGDTCQIELTSTDDDDEGSAGVYAGAGIGAVIVSVVVVVLVVIFMRRRRLSRYTQKTHGRPTEIFDNIETPVPGGSDIPKKPATIKRNKDPPDAPTVSSDEGGSVYMNVTGANKEVIYDNVGIRGVCMSELKSEMKRKKLNKAVKFQEEFKTYPWGAVFPHDNGKKSSNIAKNRFKTTFPYDHSRVILDTIGKDQDSTYINANYIDSTEESQVYVASQGPKPNTVDDFWRMVWKCNSGNIVMLTNVLESEHVKCHKYWPNEGEPLVTRHFNIRLAREWTYAFYVIRDISVVQKKTKEERQVYQFHFTTWPDHYTPDTLELSLFHRRVRSYETRQTGQTVVHCSAGLGRTGTFIGLDALLEQEQKSGRVDIPTYVRIMRKDRMNMIQTYEQYIALHDLLVEASELPDTLISRSNFGAALHKLCYADKPKNQSKIAKEFAELKSVTPHYDASVYEIGMMAENKPKNRSMSVIAVDLFRAFLQTQLLGRTDYINAVVLRSHTSRCGYLVTQFPLADTIDDLWTMVLDYNCDSMVVLGNPTEDWLREKGDAAKAQDISIERQQELSTLPDVDIVEYNVSCRRSSKEATVRIFTMKHWTSDSVQPPSTSSLLQLLELLDSRRRSDDTKPVVVMCLNGCTQSGLFCCISNARDQMKMDEEMDMFQVAREILKRRPQALRTLEQYQYCYNIIGQYLESNDVYIN